MNLISKLLPATHVLLDVETSSKKRLFEQIGLLIENQNRIARVTVFDSLFAREKLGSTGLGYGIAIPHGRIKNLRETLCAFVRTKEAIPFESADGEPVQLVFVILVPVHATEQHLQILSELAQMFSDADFRQALLEEADPAIVYQMLTQWSPYATAQRTAAV